jgi:hypothetical protein
MRDRYVAPPPAWAVLLVMLVMFAGIITGVFVLLNHGDHVSCLRLHEQTGLPTRYAHSGPDGECYIQIEDGRWVPQDRWMNMKDN